MAMDLLYVTGLAESDLEEKNGRTYYCASFIVHALIKKYDIIKDDFLAHQYGPCDFSMMYTLCL